MMVFLLGFIFWPTAPIQAFSRDCDDNAVIYCGAESRTELKEKLTKGTGKKYQSASELQRLFSYYKISLNDINNLSSGYVTNDNRVVVGGKTVGRNVYSMGRSYMAGSVKQNQFPYPIYLRHPSVSFRSATIAAYVKMNPNGTFAYAIIKSCGNIVPGVVYTPQAAPTYRIYALKWLDTNGNGTRETDEPKIPGVSFTLTGNNVNKTAVTDSTGYAWFTGVLGGTYNITESVPSGYRATTATTRTVTASGVTGGEFGGEFGNQLIPPADNTVALRVYKFNDINGNAHQDGEEPSIAGWKFNVTGPNNVSFQLTTGANGYASRDGLAPGVYTVTEVLEKGWTATTNQSLQHNIASGSVYTYIFGNQFYKAPTKSGGGEKLPSTGPIAVAAMAFSSAIFSGVAVAWARSKKKFQKAFRK
jgi:hypothetical protein